MICKAGKEDVLRIHALMEQVHDNMEDPSMFVCDDLAFVEKHIEEEGFILLAVDEEKNLCGSLIVRIPGEAKDNLGLDISLPREKLCKVAHIESAAVAPEYRGNGILQQLMQQAESEVREKQLEYLMGTVSPNNPASYQSFEKMGYEHILTKEKYGGRLRRIYFKKIRP